MKTLKSYNSCFPTQIIYQNSDLGKVITLDISQNLSIFLIKSKQTTVD